MEAIVTLIVSYCSMWMPALTAIVGVIVLLVSAFAKVKGAVNDTQTTIKEVKDDKTFKDLAQEIKEQKELDRLVMKGQNVLIDRITKIENYMDALAREKK